jgi:hypothetical protein
MKNAAGHLASHPVTGDLLGITSITNQCKRLDKKIEQGYTVLDDVIKLMSPYCETESERQLAKFGDRVSIIVGLAISGKMAEKDALGEIKLMYKDLKSMYKQQNRTDSEKVKEDL